MCFCYRGVWALSVFFFLSFSFSLELWAPTGGFRLLRLDFIYVKQTKNVISPSQNPRSNYSNRHLLVEAAHLYFHKMRNQNVSWKMSQIITLWADTLQGAHIHSRLFTFRSEKYKHYYITVLLCLQVDEANTKSIWGPRTPPWMAWHLWYNCDRWEIGTMQSLNKIKKR